MKYIPFGETLSGAVPTDKKFTGQRLDETGLYYYGARYYDATIGRFISSDTIVQSFANPQSLNRYSYTLNNPLKYIDPSGHFLYNYYGWFTEAIIDSFTETTTVSSDFVLLTAHERGALHTAPEYIEGHLWGEVYHLC